MGWSEWLGLAGLLFGLVGMIGVTFAFFALSKESREEAVDFLLKCYSHVGWVGFRLVATIIPLWLTYSACSDIWAFTISTAPITRLDVVMLAIHVVGAAYYMFLSILAVVLWISLHRKRHNPLLRSLANKTAQQ